MKHLLLPLLLLLFCNSTIAQGKELSLDSLNKVASSLACVNPSKSDSISNKILDRIDPQNDMAILSYTYLNLGNSQRCQGNFDKAKEFLKKSIELFEKSNNLEGKASSLYYLGATYKSTKEFTLGINAFKENLKLGTLLKDTTILVKGNHAISSTFLDDYKNDSAMFYLSIGLKYAEEAGFKLLQGRLLHNMGDALFRLESYSKAAETYINAIDIFDKNNGESHAIVSRHNLAGAYTYLKDYQNAIQIFKENISNAQNNEWLLGSSYFGIADAYHHLKEYKNAVQYNLLALSSCKKNGNTLIEGSVLSNLCSNYNALGDYSKSIKYGKRSIEFAKVDSNAEVQSRTNLYLAESYSAIGDYKSANNHFKQGYELKDIYNDKKQAKLITELNTKYEVEKKNLEAKNAVQEKKLTEIKLKKNKNFLSSILIAGLFSIVALLAYFNSFRNKKKAELALSDLNHAKSELQLERQYRTAELKALKAQMNPHFLFNAFNSLQSYIIENEKKLAIGYLGKFADLMRTYLNHSKESSITLQEEIEANELYLALEKVRFNDSLNYTIKVDPALHSSTIQIPPMLLQPFIENALKHGLKHKATDKQLNLFFKKVGNELICTITDNGIGRAASSKINERSQPNHQSFATDATNERIDLLNNTREHKIKIDIEDLKTDDKAAGTNVTISIPL